MTGYSGQGVIWPRVAEIALVGGLECGGFLVQVKFHQIITPLLEFTSNIVLMIRTLPQLALEALENSAAYDFVVVQVGHAITRTSSVLHHTACVGCKAALNLIF